jgi:uncharacterized membrane protein YbhN (UPF0104 family)
MVSVAILVGIGLSLDAEAILSRLTTLRGEWVAIALILSVVQVAVSAGRWRFTAARLGVALGWRTAIREYYLATFLNQVLPGGVLGDVSRAWRHGRAPTTEALTEADSSAGFDTRAAHAVILERASGQLVMIVIALASVMTLSAEVGGGARRWLLWVPIGFVIACGVAAWIFVPRLARLPVAGRLLDDARRALITGPAALVQLSTSLFVVATYIATWVAATRAVGIDTPSVTLLPLVAPVLVTMLIPITVAGWGLREAGAAALWAAIGLTAADGVAVSVAYGILVLLGALPGGIALLATLIAPKGPDQRADRLPGESGAPGV